LDKALIVDTHAHLDMDPFDSDRAEVIARALDSGVSKIVTVGINLEPSQKATELADNHTGVLATAGFHPHEADRVTEEDITSLAKITTHPAVVAIGEIGLDYVRGSETREVQKELLKYELSLARETGLPVSIHSREAHQDMMSILRQEVGSGVKGAIHGFSGDSAMLKDWLDLGFYISIGIRGVMADEVPSLEAAVREIPLDRLLTETDSGHSSGPAEVVSVVEKLASLRGTSAEEIANSATANLKRLLKL